MRLCTFRDANGSRLGEVRGDLVQPLAGRDVRDAIGGPVPPPAGDPVPIEGIDLLPPLAPGKVIGVGWNYPDHAREMGGATRGTPVVFAKLVSSVTGPASPVTRPGYTRELDYEGELAVVIGSRARAVAESRALDHVFGYAVMNDITARDMQREEPQWIRAKGGDGFGPFGPWITTADQVPDPQALGIRTWVNGDLRQDGSTAGMAFPVAALVAWCAASFTLEPGDVIATGTPPGVGKARTPPVFLQPGDVVRVEVEGLGVIENAIR
jgi:2-keto-4-pentenoate hydratase/2-oxohepta-3-ene-1,7-dioic acid hydratase in catechol pathway